MAGRDWGRLAGRLAGQLAGARDSEVARLLAMGATELWRASQGPYSWVTLADPEGNEFCVS